ncbi:radical SAM protein [Enterococcus sp. MMGLQ5-2]|nr:MULTISPECIES: radical SAM protein [unclassified Enterococcus]MBS7577813.1 radical SAM protein [Enterococcus sp. MMGLQ5-2]MBS7585073.1 radical SAM protein [Enterococcus sp. MMGLQ5-1]NPD12929.1 radical SAM protein [Enterococcus sp. MMGLQ5-1]NPD37643.1 radical SAM protein [Enterococcus sp. MMGLQ5-2]
MNNELKGLVFNIQRYSIHDGTGIRTVIFLKGCPLKCPWCANPESQKAVTPTQWLKNGKIEIIGEWLTVSEVVEEVLKDEIFFRTSGGGVTLSGGEVLTQSVFAQALLREFYELGIHTAIETTGCYSKERLASLCPYLNEILFDLKLMDSEQSKRVIGADINLVKANFELAIGQSEIAVIPRIPLIPSYTVKPDNLIAIIDYLKSLDVKRVHLLPFHQYGSSKYDYLGWDYQLKELPTLLADSLKAIQQMFEAAKLTTVMEGLA